MAFVIEDAVAVFPGNVVKPADMKRLCCVCRRVVSRNIDMKEKIPRMRNMRGLVTGVLNTEPLRDLFVD